jgi:GGDEF domain-containing protein
LVAAATQVEILGFFKELRDVRDQCAHPGGNENLILLARIADFVSSAKRMRESLLLAMETHVFDPRHEVEQADRF